MTTIKKSDLLYKPNAALVMVPKLGKLTLTSRKMYNVLLRTTQRQVIEIRKLGGVVDAEHLFSARLSDVINAFASGESDPRALAKKYMGEMRRVEVDWEAPDAREGVVWKSMGLLSEAQLELRNGSYWALWALPPSLLKAIADPEFFTPIDLDKLAQLSSYTAIALYEICIRYHNNPKGKTSSNPPEWWVDALTNTPAPIDPVTGQKRRREWRKLKNASVIDAIEEINRKMDISISLIEHKSGRTVSEVQFTVVKNSVVSEKQDDRPKVSIDLVSRAFEIGITLNALTAIQQEGHTEEEIKFGLIKLTERLKTVLLNPIGNKPAYLKSIINEISGRLAVTTVHQVNSVLLPVIEQVKPWGEQRRSALKAQFILLSKEERKPFIDAAMADLIKRGIASTTMIRKVEEGDWKTPTLLSRAVEMYAVDLDGPNWMFETNSSAQE